MSQVRIEKLVKSYGSVKVLHDVDVTIDDQEFAVIVGPSGCGKSTLLRSIAGLETVSDGDIFIGDRRVTNVDAADRGVAMVFQSYALYPHMNVRANIGFSLRMQGLPKAKLDARVEEVARTLQLESLLDRKPRHLSGGQRQRVAIGRAIIRKPDVFLFDEPLSNLDAELRVTMRSELARLHRDIGGTMVYVTHDQVEALTLADKIIVMRDGVVEQLGTATQLYDDPDNVFVASFLGTPKTNLLTFANAGDGRLALSCGQALDAKLFRKSLPNQPDLKLTIRPEHINRPEAPDAAMKLSGIVDVVENLGSLYNVYLDVGNGEKMITQHHSKDSPKVGDRYEVRFDEEDIRFFDVNGQRIRVAA